MVFGLGGERDNCNIPVTPSTPTTMMEFGGRAENGEMSEVGEVNEGPVGLSFGRK